MGVGLQQWKFIAEDSSLSFPPHDFVIPPKAMGVEWVLTNNPKVLEKRCFTLILAACCMSVSPERIVPGSEEDPFYVTKRRAAASQLFRTAVPSVPTAPAPIIPYPAVLAPANPTAKLTANGLASISGSGVVGSVGVKAEPQAGPSTLVISSLPSTSQPSSSSSSINAVIAAIPSTSSTSSSTSSSSSTASSSATSNKTTAASKQKTKSPSKVKLTSKASIHASLKRDRQKMKIGQAVRRCAPSDEGEGDLYNEDVCGSESDSSSSCPLVASKVKKEKETKKAGKEAEKKKVEKNETVGQSSPSRDISSTPLLTPNRKHPRTPPTVKSDLNALDLTHDENENENKNDNGSQNKHGSQNGSNKRSRRSISVSSNYISPPEESNTGFAMNRDSTLPTPLILSPEGSSRSSQREKNRKAAEQLAAINAANKKKEVALKANNEVKRKKEIVAVDLTCDSAEEDFEEEKENEKDDGIDQSTAATDSKTSHKLNAKEVKSISMGIKVDPSSAPVGTSDVKGKESTISSSSLLKSPGKGREGKVTEGITAGSSTTVSTTNSSSSSAASVPNVPHVSAVTSAGIASIATTGVTAKTGKRGRPPAATAAAASAVSSVATKATKAKSGIKSFFSAK